MMLTLTQTALPTHADAGATGAVERCYRLRLAGQLLGAISVAAVLYDLSARPFVWLLLLACLLAWPVLARELALRGRDAQASEIRSLLVDSALGGMWIALMRFDLLPSLLLTVMLTCDKTIAGGWTLALRGLVVQLAACVLTLAVHGLAFAPATSMPEIIASMPLLTLYPLALAFTLHAQARRLGESPRLAPPPNASAEQDVTGAEVPAA
jgi:diguanylate cyclase